MTYVFTSAAWNYLPKAQLLAKSVKRFIPGAKMILGLPDKMTEDVAYRKYDFDEVIPVSEKLISRPHYKGWVYSHAIVELATAIKPYVLCELLARPDCDAVLYFDPDIVLFSDLEDMLSEFKENSILLCPHVTIPEKEYQSIIDNELGSLKYGVYNFGYVGVKNSPDGKAFAEWWRDRCGEWCYDDIPFGVFTDQKWSDLVPCLFDGVKVLRSPRFDVATWNTTCRRFAGSLKNGFTVNGEKLGFYHFTGFDSGAHDIMLGRALAPKVQKELVQWYLDSITEAGRDPLCQRKWAYSDYSDGTKIPKEHRSYFRMDQGVINFFGDPFDVTSTENNYRNWYGRNVEGVPTEAERAFRALEDQLKKTESDLAALRKENAARAASFEAEFQTARYLYEKKIWELGQVAESRDALVRELSEMRSSKSWKMTKPFRALAALLRGSR